MEQTDRCPFRKGDIIRNDWAGDNNPQKHLMFLRCGTIKQGRFSHKGYECLAHDGRKVNLYRDSDKNVLIGHMDEYDKFVLALKKLKNIGQEVL